MATAFLDTQVWNYLVEPGLSPIDGTTAELLAAAAQRHDVVGTFDVLHELMGAGPAHGPKYKQMVTLFFDLVGHRLLLPLNRRHIGEAVSGGLLSEDSRFANRRLRRDAQSAAMRRQTVVEVADDVHAEGEDFKEQEETVRAELRRELDAAGESMKPQRLRDWYKAFDIDDWVRAVAEAGNTRGHYTIEVGEDCGPTRFPSSWMFTACRLARIPATLGEGRKIQPSDLADAHHVASGPYVDLFVTNDRELQRTIELMSCRSLPFRCVGLAEFAEL